MTTRPDLDALEKLCDAATPGPWIHDLDDTHYVRHPNGWQTLAITNLNHLDAAFIAAARNALSDVIMYARQLEGDVANAESSCEAMALMLKGAGIDLNEQNAIEKLVEERDAARAEVERLRGLVVDACSLVQGAIGCVDPRNEAAASACHEAGLRAERIRKEAAGE